MDKKYRILNTNKCSTAIDIFCDKTNNIDLIISDLQLPDSSGVDLLELIKKHLSYTFYYNYCIW